MSKALILISLLVFCTMSTSSEALKSISFQDSPAQDSDPTQSATTETNSTIIDSNTTETSDSSSNTTDTGSSTDTSSSLIYIIIVIVVVLTAIGVTAFLVLRNKKKNEALSYHRAP